MEIIYATANQGKKNQVQEFLDYYHYDVKLITLNDIGYTEEIEENRNNFSRKLSAKSRSNRKILQGTSDSKNYCCR